jgi:class 3 adenylate cyclase
MNFVDWCGHVLNTLVEALEEPEPSVRGDLDEIRFFHRLFGEGAQFVKSPERDAMRDALKELEKEGLVEGRGGGNHWKVTRAGRRTATDIKQLLHEAGEINEGEDALLRFVNKASQQVAAGADHVSLAQVSTEQLMAEFGSDDRVATYNKFHRVASELKELGLIEMKPLPGHHLNLKANLRGLLWEAGRDPLGELEMGHVLFIDVVGYSKLPMDQQALTLNRLQDAVRGTNEFRRAHSEGKLISLPTGDGMALVFFRGLTDHVECARSLSRALKQSPELRLRTGIHSGPVYRVVDINANRNVSGGGINTAQRVMDCGDAGHILLSKAVADVLLQLGNWNDLLHDLGEAEVKHGAKVHVFNLYDGEAGNPEPPGRFRGASPKGSPASAGRKLEASINHVPVKAYEGYVEHSLIIGLTNNSPKTLDDFRVEIRIPDAFINQSTSYHAEVEGRRTADFRFFRMEGKDHDVRVLRPGDRVQTFFKIDLVIPPGAQASASYDQRIVVEVFAGDDMTQKLELTMRMLLAFPPSFG